MTTETLKAAGRRPRLATVWLGGCSGCHMSLLDLDERLLDLAAQADVVYSPIVDTKVFPDDVDVTLVEGAICNEEHLETIRNIRSKTRILVALGDCAVGGNVPGLRNLVPVEEALRWAYVDRATAQQAVPSEVVPPLVERVEPLHRLVQVDAFLPGCPPSPDLIWDAIQGLLAGTAPEPGSNAPAPRFG